MHNLTAQEIIRRATLASRKATALDLHLLNWTCRQHTADKHERLDKAVDRLERFIVACESELDTRDK